jgi:hypothetical protein
LFCCLLIHRHQTDKTKGDSAMQTSGDGSVDEGGEGNPGSTSVRKVLNQSSSQHSFQHRLDNYHSIMDDDYDDRVVAEAKSSSRHTQQRKSFEDTTHSVTQALGHFAKSSSALSDMSKESDPAVGLHSPAKSVQGSSMADAKANSLSSPTTTTAAAGFGSKDESPGASSRFHVARPHHLPKMNALSGLSGNLEKIRTSMGEEVSGWTHTLAVCVSVCVCMY